MMILELHDVYRRFGGLEALRRVNMAIEKNTVVGLIGPNGAGKTTLINNISGLDHPSSGRITFQNQSIENMAPHRIARMGIARTYQNIHLFKEFTTYENILIGQHSRGKTSYLETLFFTPRFRKEERIYRENTEALLERFQLTEVAHTPASSLAYGDQRRLEMARALALNPQLILLDEPTAGMNPMETRSLGEQIIKLKEEGLTILVIEHDMSLIHQVCDQVYVLSFGEMIAHGPPDEIRQNSAVIEAYLGRDEANTAPIKRIRV
ncbi:ABC transporter ATP-binding protein [Anaerolineales bacterium]